MPLIEELSGPSGPSSRRASRSAAAASLARGFDLSRALKGAASSSKGGGEECAYSSRGDGKYDNGTHFAEVRLPGGQKAMQIGPNAFAEGEAEETMRQLQAMGAFGSKGKDDAQPKEPPKPKPAGPEPPPARPKPPKPEPAIKPSATQSPFDFNAMATALLGKEAATKSDVDHARDRVRSLDDQLDDGTAPAAAGSAFVIGATTPEFELVRDDAAQSITVNVSLPNARGPADVELDVAADELRIAPAPDVPRDTRYRLKAKLPVRVVPDSAKAKWLKAKKVLRVTLRLVHKPAVPPPATAGAPAPTVLTKAEALRGKGTVDYSKFDAIDEYAA